MVLMLDTIPTGSSEFLIPQYFGKYLFLTTFADIFRTDVDYRSSTKHRRSKVVLASEQNQFPLQSPFDVDKVSIKYTVKRATGSYHKNADFLLKNCQTTLVS